MPAIVIDEYGDSQLAEIDENLRREELSPIERSFHIARAKQIYEDKHPEATARSIQSRHAHKLNGKETAVASKPFRYVAAADLGVKPAAIDEAGRFARISGVRRVVGTCLDSAPQLRALHRLQKTRPGKASELIDRAASGEKVSAIERGNAAEELAAWISKRAQAAEIPVLLVWLRKVSAKGVGVALRKLAGAPA